MCTNKKATPAQLLSQAAIRADKMGHRWTDSRAGIYALLLQAEKPLTAYQLIEELSVESSRAIKPATVYRALEALVALDLVVKVESLNAFRACCHPDISHKHVFMLCRDCGSAEELHDHDISLQLDHLARKRGFTTSKPVLELHGVCAACA